MKTLRLSNIRVLLGVFFSVFFLILTATSYAATYTFQWNANHPSDNVDHYLFYWGTASGVYDNLVDGTGSPELIAADDENVTTYTHQKTFTDPVPELYFAVTAVDTNGEESG